MSAPRRKPSRPKYYDLNLAHLPPPGLVSIFHRISGRRCSSSRSCPLLLYLLQTALGSEAGFARCGAISSRARSVKLVLLGVVWLYAHHFFAGHPLPAARRAHRHREGARRAPRPTLVLVLGVGHGARRGLEALVKRLLEEARRCALRPRRLAAAAPHRRRDGDLHGCVRRLRRSWQAPRRVCRLEGALLGAACCALRDDALLRSRCSTTRGSACATSSWTTSSPRACASRSQAAAWALALVFYLIWSVSILWGR